MKYYRELLNGVIKYFKQKRNLALFTVILIFLISRPIDLAFYLVFLIPTYLVLKSKSPKKIILSFLALYLILFLWMGFSFPRDSSWDGLLWYLKRVLLLSEDFFLDFTNVAHKFYLGELILAGINKIFGMRVTTLVLSISALINVILIRKLIKQLAPKFSENSLNVTTFLVATSSAFLSTATFQFKMEHLLLNFFLGSLLIMIKYSKSQTWRDGVLFGILAGIAILIKILVLPFYAGLYVLLALKAFSTKSARQFLLSTLSGTMILLLLGGWAYHFGINIPWTSINYYPNKHGPTVNFTKDSKVYSQCLSELKSVDFNQFFDTQLGPKNTKIPQIVSFLFGTNYSKTIFHGLLMTSPGVIHYFSMLLFIPLVFLSKKKRKHIIYLSSVLFLIYFYLDIKTVYWYLLPIGAVSIIPFYEYFVLNSKFMKINKALLVNFGVSSLVLASLTSYGYIKFETKVAFLADAIDSKQVRELSNYINTTSGLVLDATPKPMQVFLTFVDDYDKRVVRDSLYFGYSQKTVEDKRLELLSNNIRYIATAEDSLVQVEYFGCPQRHIQQMKIFTDKYGKPVYTSENGTTVFEIE